MEDLNKSISRSLSPSFVPKIDLLENTSMIFFPVFSFIIDSVLLFRRNLFFHLSLLLSCIRFSSVQLSCSVVSDPLRPHELQHARPPCPSPTPGVHSNSCPLSRWCHPTISSSVLLFSSCPQSLLASKSFPMSQLFTWGGQSTGVSALASFPKEHLGLISFRMDWMGLLAVQGTLKSLLQHHSSKASILQCSAFFIVHTWLLKNHSLD